MKYYEVEFRIDAPAESMQDARDLLAALAGEAGFETFEETEEGLKGYIQQPLFDQEQLVGSLGAMFCVQPPAQPAETLEQTGMFAVSFTVSEAEDRDWNEQWEQEGFDPIVIKADRALIIHDGRHFGQYSIPSFDVAIEIDAHLAFGTGNHETTRMIVATLLSLPLQGKRILDCGCGTGILAITALKLGASEAVGYDIDEWSADNARHNAVINQVDDRFTSLLGDARILDGVEGTFDVVLANINRNILLADMPAFRKKMAPGAVLVLSGFYENDIPMLTNQAQSLGMVLKERHADGDWACIVLS